MAKNIFGIQDRLKFIYICHPNMIRTIFAIYHFSSTTITNSAHFKNNFSQHLKCCS